MSRIDFGAKPLCYPQPVFMIATYGEDGTPDVMNAAWGGISEMTEITLCLSANHLTTKNILSRRAFTVSMADADHVAGCDYAGIASGNQVPDKFARAGFTHVPSARVDAPVIQELAVCLECRLISYDEKSCILKGEIVNVSVDERAMTDGKADVSKIRPIAFDPFNNAYHVLGERVGGAWDAGQELK